MAVSRTIVIGVDGSSEARAALAWAQAIATPTDRLVALWAWQVPIVGGYDMVAQVDTAEIEGPSSRALAEFVAEARDERVVPVLREGHAGRRLVEEAADADMIVVGHRGSNRMSMMLGSTANYVLHHTSTPVVIVRGEHETAPKRVVVGVDAADDEDHPSIRALRWAFGLPGVEEVVALHGWFLPPVTIGMFTTVSDDLEAMDESARRVAERAVNLAGDPPSGVSVVSRSARGSGATSLVAASRSADLVVVGRRGHGGFAELVLGSTTLAFAPHSHAPVAVIS